MFHVYTITIDDCVYVGSTENIASRIHQHLQKLKEKKHHNKPLQEKCVQIGFKHIKINILEEYESGTEAHNREWELILQLGANCCNSKRTTNLTFIKRANIHSRASKAIVDSNELVFGSISTAAIYHNTSPTSIGKILHGQRKALQSGVSFKYL